MGTNKNGTCFLSRRIPVRMLLTGLVILLALISGRSSAGQAPQSGPLISSVQQAGSIVNHGLLAWYSFECTIPACQTIPDLSGNGNNLGVIGTVVSTPGVFGGQASSFSGQGYLQGTVNPAAGKRQVSFALWFKTPQPEENLKLASAAWWNGGPGSGWVLATHMPEFWSEDTTSLFTTSPVNVDNNFAADQWIYEVVTYDGARLKEYTNAVLINDWEVTGAALGPGSPLAIGGWPDVGFRYYGAIDEFKIFDRCLTETEILMEYTNQVPWSYFPLIGN